MTTTTSDAATTLSGAAAETRSGAAAESLGAGEAAETLGSGEAMCVSAAGRVPLVVLLARCQSAFVEEFDGRLAGSEFAGLSLAHSRNVLRHLGAGPQRASQLVAACEVTKQAISQQLTQLERGGYVVSMPDPGDQRARQISLTAKGRRAQELISSLFDEIEADWGSRIGDDGLVALRHALTTVGSLPVGGAPDSAPGP